jgi:uncharacterized membrane protein YcaP (DUF421 family)
MEQQIVAFDFQRMFFGDGPPLFYLEILVRTLIIYFFTLILLRWLGSRTVGQLSTIEFLLVIALGSAVGDAMFYPDVPLLHAMVVVTIIVVANRMLDRVMQTNTQAERFIDGQPREVIRDGVLSARFLRKGPISRDELFQRLRECGIEHTGEVRRAYIEKDGQVTAFRYRDGVHKGLPIVPPFPVERPAAIELEDAEGKTLSCMRCGKIRAGTEVECTNCGDRHWTESVG